MIPFHKIYETSASREYMDEVLEGGKLSGDGIFTRKCEAYLERMTGAEKVLLTSSCSIALDMCAILIGAGPGDEILVPSYTFVTTAGAFYNLGATPVFVDCMPGTLNMDVDHAARLITDKTKAIVPMHYGGVGCDMEAIMQLAEAHGLYVIEDAAQALDGYKDGQHLGTFGHLATISFHDTKNIVCGEGGALLINNPELIERAEIIREKGTNRKQFFQGQVDKYTWHDRGSSYVAADILAAYLLGQLEAHKDIKTRRKVLYEMYMDGLADFPVDLPVIPEGCDPSYHLFHVILPAAAARDGVMAAMKEAGVQVTSHYVPLHTSPVGLSLGGQAGSLPVTEDLSQRLIRLPLYPDLSSGDINKVINSLSSALQNQNQLKAGGA